MNFCNRLGTGQSYPAQAFQKVTVITNRALSALFCRQQRWPRKRHVLNWKRHVVNRKDGAYATSEWWEVTKTVTHVSLWKFLLYLAFKLPRIVLMKGVRFPGQVLSIKIRSIFNTQNTRKAAAARGYKGLQGWPTARVSGWWQLAGETKSTSVENWN
jgi:hypothetical protein